MRKARLSIPCSTVLLSLSLAWGPHALAACDSLFEWRPERWGSLSPDNQLRYLRDIRTMPELRTPEALRLLKRVKDSPSEQPIAQEAARQMAREWGESRFLAEALEFQAIEAKSFEGKRLSPFEINHHAASMTQAFKRRLDELGVRYTLKEGIFLFDRSEQLDRLGDIFPNLAEFSRELSHWPIFEEFQIGFYPRHNLESGGTSFSPENHVFFLSSSAFLSGPQHRLRFQEDFGMLMEAMSRDPEALRRDYPYIGTIKSHKNRWEIGRVAGRKLWVQRLLLLLEKMLQKPALLRNAPGGVQDILSQLNEVTTAGAQTALLWHDIVARGLQMRDSEVGFISRPPERWAPISYQADGIEFIFDVPVTRVDPTELKRRLTFMLGASKQLRTFFSEASNLALLLSARPDAPESALTALRRFLKENWPTPLDGP